MKAINDLYDYKNMKIAQDTRYFKFSVDSILLAEFVKVRNEKLKILDICTGNAAISLILSSKCNNSIVGYEIQKEIYELAVESVQINDKKNQINIVNDNIKNIGKIYSKNYFDIIVCNPPYYKNSIININEVKSIARHEIKINLEELFKIASSYIVDKGEFYLIHLANRLGEICNFSYVYNLNMKEICFIYTKEQTNASLVLVKMIKNSKKGLKVLTPIYINRLSTYQNIFKEAKK